MFVIAEAKAVDPSAAYVNPHERVAAVAVDDAFANTGASPVSNPCYAKRKAYRS